MSIAAASALRGFPSALDAHRRVISHDLISSFKTVLTRHTDFVVNRAQLGALNHTGIHTTNPVLFDPQAKGDKWSSLTAVVRVPALTRNTTESSGVSAGRDGDCYYVNNAGIALFRRVCIRSGNVDGYEMTDRDYFHNYMSFDPHANQDMDVRIHRFSSLSQLKQFSASNCTWTVPLYDPMIKMNRIHANYSLNGSIRQAVELKVTMRPLSEIMVNEYVDANYKNLIPYKYGTTTPVASSDILVDFYSNFHIMSPEERHVQKEMWMSADGWHVPLSYPVTYERPTPEATGTLIDWQLSPNHPCSGYYVFFQADSYIDKTAVSPQGVGLVNYYDYSASHGGETLYANDMKWNSGSYLDSTHPVSWLRSQWADHHEFLKKPYTTMYFVPYANKIDAECPDKTVNHSNIDKFNIVVRKNISDVGILYAMFLIHNVFTYKNGFANRIFV